MVELSLENIAELLHEHRTLSKRTDLTEKERGRCERVGYVLGNVTLTGEQLMEMEGFDPLILGDNDVKRSVVYEELEDRYNELKERYDSMEKRLTNIKSSLRKALSPFYELARLIDE